jgi:midasin
VVELVTSLSHMLEKARHRMAGGSLAQPPLNQLVLIISDGRFHEKESLRRIVAVSPPPPTSQLLYPTRFLTISLLC